ncbi:hypothetical protein EPICR_140042 [Candidatus Desulfarcum epimagneticum]|uniref:Uncharacterized protein n=1 Tax=uncultured Desulfobacteraceae bacterium TaxID=218296 RepID=A0A484HFR0_9BACT|nr:hypothetical protein EPICR_140042 [uncultured Desulfobacteraceae bacterium]
METVISNPGRLRREYLASRLKLAAGVHQREAVFSHHNISGWWDVRGFEVQTPVEGAPDEWEIFQ